MGRQPVEIGVYVETELGSVDRDLAVLPSNFVFWMNGEERMAISLAIIGALLVWNLQNTRRR